MLPIKEENKLFSRLLTKESSMANPSFRVYYGGNSLGVPFVWEAKPGTPKYSKHNFSKQEENKDYLPPLTPPPSYYLKQPQKLPNKRPSSKILLGMFFKSSMHRRQISSASSTSSNLSCPSSSMLVTNSTMRNSGRSSSLSSNSISSHPKRRTLSSPGSLFDLLVNGQDDDEQNDVSPTSVLCFGIVGNRKIRGCFIADH